MKKNIDKWEYLKEPNTVNSYLIVRGQQQIATVHENEEIAKLVTAAPALLIALKRLAKRFDEVHHSGIKDGALLMAEHEISKLTK